MPNPLEPTHTHMPGLKASANDDTASPKASEAHALPQFAPPTVSGEIGRLGKYRVLKELGHGGMGAVYLAFDEKLERQVALKVMLPNAAANPTARDRFLREARAAAKINSDYVVGIYEADEIDGTPYIALQFLEGAPLDQYVKQKGTLLPLSHVLQIARETALGLAAAHQLGMVHRDIKPGNIWLEKPRGRVKILDFGLAKPVEGSTGIELTQSGAIIGTPAYMAPEQGLGKPVDGRADLFSLGCMMYRLVTGQLPFERPTLMGVLAAIATEEPTAIPVLNPNVPEGVGRLIHRLLAKKPEQRPASAAEVAKELQSLQTALATSSATVPVVITKTADTIVEPLPHGTIPADDPFAHLNDREENTAAEPPTAQPKSTEARTEVAEPSIRPGKPCSFPTRLVGGLFAGLLLLAGGFIIIMVMHKDGPVTELKLPDDVKSAEIEKNGKTIANINIKEPTKEIAKKEEPKATGERKIDYAYERKLVERMLRIGQGEVGLRLEQGELVRLALKPESMLPEKPFVVDELKFSGPTLSDDELLLCEGCRNLRTLSLEGTDAITPRGLSAFRGVRQLKTLSVWGKSLGEPTELLKTNPLLESLSVVIHDAQLLKNCPRLRYISIGGPTIEEQIRLLPEACPDLSSVYFQNVPDIKMLRPLGQLKRLRRLQGDFHLVSDPDLGKFLANAPCLDTISCRENDLKSLLKNLKPLGGQLRELRLVVVGEAAKTPLTVDDVAPFTELNHLNAVGFYLSDADLLQLGALPRLKQLELGEYSFRQSGNPMTDAGVDAFRRLRPDVGARIGWVDRTRYLTALNDWPGKMEGSRAVAAWNLPKDAPSPALMPFTPDEAKKHQEAWAAFIKQSVEVESKATGMKFRLIPPTEQEIDTPTGKTLQRSEHPFFLGTTEVTVGHFKKFVEATGYKTEAEEKGNARNNEFLADPKSTWRTPGYDLVDTLPVNVVSPRDMQAFCEWLSKQDNAIYRLPAESEWEFAARGGNEKDYGFAGPDEKSVLDYAWFKESTMGLPQQFKPVGTKKANPFGLYDVLGNVWETTVSPSGLVLRGGGSNDSVVSARNFSRYPYSQDIQPNVGFRVLRQTTNDPPPKPGAQPVLVQRHQSLSPIATVARPTPIAGIRSWSIEMARPTGRHLHHLVDCPILRLTAAVDAAQGCIRIWDREGTLKQMLLASGVVERLAVTADDSHLVARSYSSESGRRTDFVEVWETRNWKRIASYPVPYNGYLLRIAHSGKQLATFGEGGIRISSLYGEMLHSDPAFPSVHDAVWSSDERILFCVDFSMQVRPWDVAKRVWLEYLTAPDLKPGEAQGKRLALSQDGKQLATIIGGKLRIWDAKTYQHVKTIPAEGQYPMWSPKQQLIATFDDNNPHSLIDVASGKATPIERLGAEWQWSDDGTKIVKSRSLSFLWHPRVFADRILVSSGAKRVWCAYRSTKTIRIFDAETGIPTEEPATELGNIVTFSPDESKRLYSGDGEKMTLVSGNKRLHLPSPKGMGRWWFSPDGKLLAGHKGSKILLFNTDDATLRGELEQPFDPGHAHINLAFSPNSKQIATTGSGPTGVRLWDSVTYKLIKHFDRVPAGGYGLLSGLAWELNGRDIWIVVGVCNTSRLDNSTGSLTPMEDIQRFSFHYSQALSADPTGEGLLNGDIDGNVVLRESDGSKRLLWGAGFNPTWHASGRGILGSSLWGGARAYDTHRHERLGVLYPEIQDGNHWLVVGPEGHYRGSKGVEEHFVYVAELDDGSHVTLTPKEFAAVFQWQNDPNKARLMKLAP